LHGSIRKKFSCAIIVYFGYEGANDGLVSIVRSFELGGSGLRKINSLYKWVCRGKNLLLI
jgi:hypothetical protein